MTIDYMNERKNSSMNGMNISIKYCQKLSEKNLKHFEHGKAALVFFYVPKVLKIITDLSKTVHFGKYYFNKLQLNFKKYL
jgi:hypothetical protein